MNTKKIGRTIAFLRNFYGMTQKELAEKLGVTDKAVSRWERGIGSPDISLLTKLSIILDIDIESILEGNVAYIDPHWKGILNLNYPEEIYADTQMFGKRLIYFQLGFFLLAGIREIYICGIEYDISFAKAALGTGEQLGCFLHYEIKHDRKGLENIKYSDFFSDINQIAGIFLIEKLDFLYGKDLTRSFHRIMYDSKEPMRLANYNKRPISMYFYPSKHEIKFEREDIEKMQTFERGVIAFQIKTQEDLLDAALLLRILEKHQGEKIGDLEEISNRRDLL